MMKADIVKVTQHCFCTGLAHCPVMVGPLPLLIFLSMTGLTGFATDIATLSLAGITC